MQYRPMRPRYAWLVRKVTLPITRCSGSSTLTCRRIHTARLPPSVGPSPTASPVGRQRKTAFGQLIPAPYGWSKRTVCRVSTPLIQSTAGASRRLATSRLTTSHEVSLQRPEAIFPAHERHWRNSPIVSVRPKLSPLPKTRSTRGVKTLLHRRGRWRPHSTARSSLLRGNMQPASHKCARRLRRRLKCSSSTVRPGLPNRSMSYWASYCSRTGNRLRQRQHSGACCWFIQTGGLRSKGSPFQGERPLPYGVCP